MGSWGPSSIGLGGEDENIPSAASEAGIALTAGCLVIQGGVKLGCEEGDEDVEEVDS